MEPPFVRDSPEVPLPEARDARNVLVKFGSDIHLQGAGTYDQRCEYILYFHCNGE
jgi:hypothetical protein